MMTGQSATAVHVRRTIAAPPERVYRACDPELMGMWLAPSVLDPHPDVAEQVGPGWESALDALVAVGW